MLMSNEEVLGEFVKGLIGPSELVWDCAGGAPEKRIEKEIDHA